MAIGDLAVFQNAAVKHAKLAKELISEAKDLLNYYQKLNLAGTVETAAAPLANADLANYATFCQALQDFSDSVAVTAGDRRQVFERVATVAIPQQVAIS